MKKSDYKAPTVKVYTLCCHTIMGSSPVFGACGHAGDDIQDGDEYEF